MIFSLAGASALIVLSLAALGTSTARIALSLGCFWGGLALLGPFLMTRFDLFAAMVTLGAVCAILYRRRAPRARPARARDRDEDLPCRARAAPRSAGSALGWRPCGRAGDRPLGRERRPRLPAVRAPRARGRRAERVAPAGAAAADREPRLGCPARAPPRPRHAARLGLRRRLPEPDGHGRLGGRLADDTRRRRGAPLRLGALREGRQRGRRPFRRATRRRRPSPSSRSGRFSRPSSSSGSSRPSCSSPGRRGIGAVALLLAACALTRLWFPRTYWLLVREFDPTSSWLVLVRDILLVSVFAALVVRVAGVRARTRASTATALEPA